MRKQHNKGFTLVEMIVSIALLAMIALFMLPLSTHSLQYSKWNNIKLTATNLAYTQLEWLKTLDYEDQLGLKSGPSPYGIVEKDQYMNGGSATQVIGGVDYSLLTNIYWQAATSSEGTSVTKATKIADVTVTAWDPISGTQRNYSVIGTLLAFEGERSFVKPEVVWVMQNEDFTNPMEGVRVNVENDSDSVIDFDYTNEEGVIIFEDLGSSDKYLYQEKADMLARPTGVTGTAPNQDWTYKTLMKADEKEKTLFIDYPAYIHMPHYGLSADDNTFMNGLKVVLTPSYTPAAGEVIPVLNTNLTGLTTKPLWRKWTYTLNTLEYEVSPARKDTYRIMDSSGEWNKTFEFYEDRKTDKDLYLAFGITGGRIISQTRISRNNYTIIMELLFSSDITDASMNKIRDGSVAIDLDDGDGTNFDTRIDNMSIVKAAYNRLTLTFTNCNENLDASSTYFKITTTDTENLVNSYGVTLPIGNSTFDGF